MLSRIQNIRTLLGNIKEKSNSDPFRILIGTILSHRTRDEMTEKASNELFKRFNNSENLANASEKEIQELIKPTGFYRVKAKRIKEVSKIIIEEFEGKVPSDIQSLLSLPMVGRKTANCVLVYGFNIPAIPVDTHVHRISNRLNLVQTIKPEETESDLVDKVERKYWLDINELFVRFGQSICKPITPLCGKCNLRDSCAYYEVKVKTSNTKP
jgi:endonuclease-3